MGKPSSVERLGTKKIGALLWEMSSHTTFSLLVYAICGLFGWLATSLIRTEKFYAFGALAVVLVALVIFVRLREPQTA